MPLEYQVSRDVHVFDGAQVDIPLTSGSSKTVLPGKIDALDERTMPKRRRAMAGDRLECRDNAAST